MDEQKRPRSRATPTFFKFGLRFFFIAVAVVCVYLAIKVSRAAKQRQAIAIVQSAGGYVLFDYMFRPDGKGVAKNWDKLEPRAWTWARQLFGDEWFQEIRFIHLEHSKVTNEELRELTGILPSVRFMDLTQTSITDEALRGLSRCRNLEWIGMLHTKVGDEGFRHIGKCKKLTSLQTGDLPITDVGVSYLSRLNLEALAIGNCPGVTNEGVRMIVSHFPNLKFLNIYGTTIDESVSDDLRKLKHLTLLNVEETGIGSDTVLPGRKTSN